MNPRIWKWINRIFLSGIWVQPFAMAALIWFFKNVLQGDVSYLILFLRFSCYEQSCILTTLPFFTVIHAPKPFKRFMMFIKFDLE